METSTIFIFIGFTVVASLAIAALIQINGNDWVDGNRLKDNGEFTMKTLDILEEITSNTCRNRCDDRVVCACRGHGQENLPIC